MKIQNLFRQAIVYGMLVSLIPTVDMEAKDIKLPKPEFTGGMLVNEVVAKRHSVREFDSSRDVEPAKLGQALWMALGVNRPDATAGLGKNPANRTNPTTMNWQEIEAYLFCKDGVWKYDPQSHSLVQVAEGDHRALLAGTPGFSQDFVMDAPVSVLFVADMRELPDDERATMMAMIDAGIACENLNLACVSLGLATVPRATMDAEGIQKLLGLTARQLPVMNNPVGYAK